MSDRTKPARPDDVTRDENAPPLTYEQEIHAVLYTAREHAKDLARMMKADLPNVRGNERKSLRRTIDWVLQGAERADRLIDEAARRASDARAAAPEPVAWCILDNQNRPRRAGIDNDSLYFTPTSADATVACLNDDTIIRISAEMSDAERDDRGYGIPSLRPYRNAPLYASPPSESPAVPAIPESAIELYATLVEDGENVPTLRCNEKHMRFNAKLPPANPPSCTEVYVIRASAVRVSGPAPEDGT